MGHSLSAYHILGFLLDLAEEARAGERDLSGEGPILTGQRLY